MGGRTIGVGVLVSVLGSSGAMGQAFPAVRVGEAVYRDDPGSGLDPFDTFGVFPPIAQGGDVDGDGIDDVVVLTRDSFAGYLYLYRGLVGGGFEAPVFLSTFSSVVDILLSDVDGDGAAELVTQKNGFIGVSSYSVSGGLVRGPVRYIDGMDTETLSIEAADLDGDGREETIVSGTSENVVLLVHGDDETYAQELIHTTIRAGRATDSVRACDLDGDGDPDLVGADDSGLLWLENLGSGWAPGFEPWDIDLGSFVHEGRAKALADVDGNGSLDAVVYGERDGEVGFGFVLTPIVGGEVREIPMLVVPEFSLFNQSVHLRSVQDEDWAIQSPGDLDGDGVDDLYVFPTWSRCFRILDPMDLNGGRMVAREMIALGDGEVVRGEDGSPSPFERAVPRVGVVDVNGDGVLDRISAHIVAREGGGSSVGRLPPVGWEPGVELSAWLVGATKGGVLDETDWIYSAQDQLGVLPVDTDGDGDPELISVTRTSVRMVDRDPSTGWFGFNGQTRFVGQASTPRGRSGFVTSLDQDPGVDLVSHNFDGSGFPAVYLNVESGPFDVLTRNEPVVFDPSVLGAEGISMVSDGNVVAGDLDGDGDTDLVLRGVIEQSGGLSGLGVLVWLNDGDGRFTAGAVSGCAGGGADGTSRVCLSDVDGDGDPDLIVLARGDGDGEIVVDRVDVLLNDGDGSFVEGSSVELGDELFEGAELHVGDIDGDGFVDAFVVKAVPDDADDVQFGYVGGEVFWGNGSGFDPVSALVYGRRGTFSGGMRDLDGDGLMELLLMAQVPDHDDGDTCLVGIVRQRGARDLVGAVHVVDERAAAMGFADLDGDGLDDWLMVGDQAERVIRVFHGVGDVCAADLNLDGDLDFFDVSAFLGYYAESEPIADFNGDGAFDFFDLSAFLGAFAAGCP